MEDMCYERRRAEACVDKSAHLRTSERGGEGDCVKEGGGGEGERKRELGCYYATALDIEVDPQCHRFG